jgi:ABC-type branched-subunit amino acid transport system ATPase component
MKQTDPVIEARGLSFQIGGAAIVEDCDLRVDAGQTVGLIGPNGAGKTTLLDLLSGFIKPSAGAVMLSGTDVTRLRPYRRAGLGLARTFQESPAIGDLTVREHVQLARENGAARRGGRAEYSPDELLDLLQLTRWRGERAAELAAPERRLLDVARALASEPLVLLLDEPFAGLAAVEQELLFAQFDRLRARGAAILIVEHRLALLDRVADWAFVLVRGRPLAQGTVAEVLKNPQVQQAYLGGDGGKVAE